MNVKAMQWLIMVTLCLCFAADGFGDDKKWQDELELSYVETGGNTELTTVSLKNLLKYQFNERLKSAWDVSALYSESEGVRTAESFASELRADYKLGERLFAYGLVGYLKDDFAGFEDRYFGGLGVGYTLLEGPTHILSSEIGLNYSVEDYTNETDSRFVEGRAFVSYEFAFSEKSRFTQTLEYLYDFDDTDNYRVNSDTGLRVQLNTILSLKIGYEVRYDNMPTPDTLEDTDTRFYTAIVASF